MTTAQFPVGWNILLNAGAWFVIHVGASFFTSRLPLDSFDTAGWLYRTRSWELGGRLYERVFFIRGWKWMLPDGAAAFRSGFRKRHMTGRSPEYCRTFARETCRAELSHWLVFMLVPLFFLWDPWWVAWPMVPYAVAVNAPCIMAQRYNRPRLAALAARGAI
ncbi:MAG: glycosyl-4,4'-diaponeurosporenoate acyltransferase [Spirochaetia bacterium]